jgi:hypothetical protein
MINTLRKLKLGIVRSCTPHVGNKLKRKYDDHTLLLLDHSFHISSREVRD